MLLIGDGISDVDSRLNAILSNADRLEAQASLPASLPTAFRKNGMRRLQRLPRDEQRRLINDWIESHPAEARLTGVLDDDEVDAK